MEKLETITNTAMTAEQLKERIDLQIRTVQSIIYDPTHHSIFEKEYAMLKQLSQRYYQLTNSYYNATKPAKCVGWDLV